MKKIIQQDPAGSGKRKLEEYLRPSLPKWILNARLTAPRYIIKLKSSSIRIMRVKRPNGKAYIGRVRK